MRLRRQLSLAKPLKALLVFAGLLLAVACASAPSPHSVSAQPKDVAPANLEPLPVNSDHSPLKLPLIAPRILVKKSQRQLLLFSGDKLMRTYRIGLGLSPVGDKVHAGDHRTPEGDFYVFTKNDKSAFYLSLGVSYPNAVHAERGLRDGLITRTQYETILRAVKAKKTPPQNTRLGGTIYIHGNGAQSDWTWGCVALENEDIRELFGAVSVGTPVTIQP